MVHLDCLDDYLVPCACTTIMELCFCNVELWPRNLDSVLDFARELMYESLASAGLQQPGAVPGIMFVVTLFSLQAVSHLGPLETRHHSNTDSKLVVSCCCLVPLEVHTDKLISTCPSAWLSVEQWPSGNCWLPGSAWLIHPNSSKHTMWQINVHFSMYMQIKNKWGPFKVQILLIIFLSVYRQTNQSTCRMLHSGQLWRQNNIVSRCIKWTPSPSQQEPSAHTRENWILFGISKIHPTGVNSVYSH